MIILLLVLSVAGCATTKEEPLPPPLPPVIDAGRFTVPPPPGPGWEMKMDPQRASVVFERATRGENMPSTFESIAVFEQKIDTPGIAPEAAVKRIWEQDMRNAKRQVPTDLVTIERVRQDTLSLGDRQFYTLRFTVGDYGIMRDVVHLYYLYFPPEFIKNGIFYRFVLYEMRERFSGADADAGKLDPVAGGFTLKR